MRQRCVHSHELRTNHLSASGCRVVATRMQSNRDKVEQQGASEKPTGPLAVSRQTFHEDGITVLHLPFYPSVIPG